MRIETVSSSCPYCGEMIELVIDCSVSQQRYIEDCFVCCRPIMVSVQCDEDSVSVALQSEDETG